jgi:putative oxidoreductase
MRDLMSNQVRLGVTLLRVAVASVFVIHGITRLMNTGVGGFGEFIGSWGLPAGIVLAWAITVIEVLGGLSLAAGYGVRVLAAWFAIVIGTGIVMVHASDGWFVVGAGRNGAEYSVLIIASLVAVALTDPVGLRVGRSR